LTLLDEFEQDAKVVIGILESNRKRIANWRRDFQRIDRRSITQRGHDLARKTMNDMLKMYDSFVSSWQEAFARIRPFLTVNMPNAKPEIEKGLSAVTNEVRNIIDRLGEHPLNPPGQPAAFHGDIYAMIGELEFCIGDLRDTLGVCVRTVGEQHQSQTIEIEIDKFSKGPSKQLLQDLASCPSGVVYNAEQHGKRQPGTLKERLKHNGYERFLDFFHKDKERIYCDKKIRLTKKNNTV
jgi:hypothetical protein